METLVLTATMANPKEVEVWCNSLIGRSAPGYPEWTVEKVLQIHVLETSSMVTRYIVFLVVAVSLTSVRV